MKRYSNIRSGVSHYHIGKDFIEIKFKDRPNTYIYTNKLNGKVHIDEMKKLAKEGKGLATYINQHPEVRDHFEKGKKLY